LGSGESDSAGILRNNPPTVGPMVRGAAEFDEAARFLLQRAFICALDDTPKQTGGGAASVVLLIGPKRTLDKAHGGSGGWLLR